MNKRTLTGEAAVYIKDGNFVSCTIVNTRKRLLRKTLYLIVYTVREVATGPKKIDAYIYGHHIEEDVPAKPEQVFKRTAWVKESELIFK